MNALLGILVVLAFSTGLTQLSFADYDPERNAFGIEGFNLTKWFDEGLDERHSVTYEIEEVCDDEYSIMVYLNYTITNGTLKGICSEYITELSFEIETDADGVLFLDIPRDVFDNRLYDDYDAIFNVEVFSTKHKTHDYRPYLERIYYPPAFVEDSGVSLSYDAYVSKEDMTQCGEYDHQNDVCLKQYDENDVYRGYGEGLTYEEFYEITKNKDLVSRGLSTAEHLIVTKTATTDTFDRYKIPFLKDDYLFKFQQDGLYSGSLPYMPEKYMTPIRQASATIDKSADPPTENIIPFTQDEDTALVTQDAGPVTEDESESSCRVGLVPISRPNADRVLCVKPTTAEKLVERGWILLD